MRKNKAITSRGDFHILALDDDAIMTSTLQAYFLRSGYQVDVENDPYQAIERIRGGGYDILLLDFLMTPICGDQVVEQIRKFNQDLFIILLTGHKSMAPPIKTIRELDIQGYYEKSDRFDQLELLVESCVKSIKQMRTIQHYQTGLSQIVDTLPELYKIKNTDDILEETATLSVHMLGGTDAVLMMDKDYLGQAREEDAERYLICCTGENFLADKQEELPEFLRRLDKDGSIFKDSILSTPMYNEQHMLIGAICVKLEKEPEFYKRQLFEVFTRQAAAAIHNSLLHVIVNEQKNELEKAYEHLRDNYMDVVSAVRLLVDAKDIYTRGHSDRVSYYAVKLAQAMGKDEAYCERVRVAGLFHDIGKVGVPDEILSKNSKLTDEEYEAIKQHSVKGYEILSAISLFKDIAPIVRSHHERVDGKGYPDGISGKDIPEEARMIAVADSFDAMTSDRRYRKSLGFEWAVNELKACKGTQFDPEMVDDFVAVLKDFDAIEQEIEWTHRR